MNKLNIFILSTGCYNQYLDFLYPTLNRLFPMLEKNIYLISDINKPYNLNNTIKYNYYHICDLPYPFITYFKANYIIDCIKQFNINKNEYFIFLDVDSIILEKQNEFWNNLLNIINKYKLCFAISPWKGSGYAENKKNKESITYILNTNLDIYIQSSLFFGIISYFNDILIKYNQYISIDSKNKIIPFLNEQSIFNKLIIDDKLQCICDYYILNYYKNITIKNLNNIEDNLINNSYYDNMKYHNDCLIKYKEYINIFCVQKFNPYIKDNKRNFRNII